MNSPPWAASTRLLPAAGNLVKWSSTFKTWTHLMDDEQIVSLHSFFLMQIEFLQLDRGQLFFSQLWSLKCSEVIYCIPVHGGVPNMLLVEQCLLVSLWYAFGHNAVNWMVNWPLSCWGSKCWRSCPTNMNILWPSCFQGTRTL